MFLFWHAINVLAGVLLFLTVSLAASGIPVAIIGHLPLKTPSRPRTIG